jgi:hypothetical protein
MRLHQGSGAILTRAHQGIVTVALLLASVAPARAGEDGPGQVRLSPPRALDAGAANRRRGRLELVTGEVILSISAANTAAIIGMFVYAQRCDTGPFHDSDCGVAVALPALIAVISAGLGSIVGVALVATGVIRIRDAERLRVAPTVDAHGAGLGLSLNF